MGTAIKTKITFLLPTVVIATLLVVGIGTVWSQAEAELTLPAEPGAEQVIVLLNPDKVDESQPLAVQEDQVAAVQDEVIARNDTILDETKTTKFENVPAFATEMQRSDILELATDPDVATIQTNKLYAAELSDTVGLINADTAHSLGFDGTGWAVGVLDTGTDSSHAFLNVVSEACYSNAGGSGGGTSLCPGGVSSSTATGSGVHCNGITGCDHGTHVSGIATGDGSGAAFSGIAKGASVISVQIFTRYDGAICTGAVGYTPCLLASDADIISGLGRILTLHNDGGFAPDISSVNMSLGTGTVYDNQTTCDNNNAATKTAIDNLRAVGIATVIASGNSGSGSGISSPGCISTAVAVGSTTKADAVSSFSNTGSLLDLLAPGSSISSSIIGSGNFGVKSGTSMAAPHVAGAWAIAKDKKPSASVTSVLQAFSDTGIGIVDPLNGLTFKRIDIEAMLAHANLNDIIATVTDGSSSEGAGTASIRFSLGSMPSDAVTIPLSVSDSTEATLSGVTQIVIAAANWNQPANNEITITGVDDADGDGDVTYSLVTGDPTSSDATYNALTANDTPNPSLINNDDEVLNGDIVFGDTNGDGVDEGYFVKYTGTGSGKIEIHQWQPGYQGWVANYATNHPSVQQSDVEVLFGDITGDGRDEAHFVKYVNTGSGEVEIHTWAPGFQSWIANSATNHPTEPKMNVGVRFGDVDGNGIDDAHFIKFANVGSGKIEIHRWAPGYQSWVSNIATNHDVVPRREVDVAFGRVYFPFDTAHFIKFNEGQSNLIEVHAWASNYQSWLANHTTTHGEVLRYDNGFWFGDVDGNGVDDPNFTKLSNTGSSTVEIHTLHANYSDWRFHYSTNHPQL